MNDWQQARAEFPALANRVFLNTATFGQMPRRASEAIARHIARRDELACGDFLEWFDDADAVRASCARLVHCDASDIAFVPTASAGLSFLLQGLDWKPGDEVLTLEHEFPNQLYLSGGLTRFGVTQRIVPWPRFYDVVGPQTRAVFLSTVNYASGFRVPLEEISGFLRQRGVLLYVDGTQSVGALQFNVQTLRPDILCVDAYKWLLSPNGAGFLYVAPELRRRLPATVIGWRSDKNWRQVNALNHGEPVFTEAAEKYEGGMLPFACLYAMGASLEMVLELGPAHIESRVLGLASNIRGMLRDLGAEVNGDESQIVTACFPGRDSSKLAGQLRERAIVVSARHGRLRISPHFYNNEEDVEALRSALSSAAAASRGAARS